jgi:hypothetical protein
LVIGLFPSPTEAALCLDNLAEADFGPNVISLVMSHRADVAKLADSAGPLNAISVEDLPAALGRLGLSPKDAQSYRDGVLAGQVFIAVTAGGAASTVEEMLRDAGAVQVRVLREVPR